MEVWEWGIARGRSENVGFHWVDQQPSGGQIDRRGILDAGGDVVNITKKMGDASKTIITWVTVLKVSGGAFT